MNAVKMFRKVVVNPEKVESVDLKGFLTTGDINIKFKNLTEQEKEDLSHLRINNCNGIIFDDRDCNPSLKLL